MSKPSVVIAGGGPVGLALACACRGFSIRVIEASPAPSPVAQGEFETRVYALSPGTRDFLRECGAWDRLDAGRIASVGGMHVFGDGGAKLVFSPPAGDALAFIVEGGRLSAALEAACAASDEISVSHGALARDFSAQASGAWVELESAERIPADLLVGADGPDSRVRAAFGMAVVETPYAEEAVVANFDVERAHEGVARQWFRADGVLAWLPLPGNRISIVWSTPSSHAAALAVLEAREFEARVREAGASVLGEMRLVSATARFPLRLIRVRRIVAPGVALVGDAAHAVHPLAGQGVNLGFQDARALAQALASRSPLERPGDLRVLRRYARSRQEDVSAMQFVTHRLDRLFAAETPGVGALRNLGLGAVDTQGWLKRALIARAMR